MERNHDDTIELAALTTGLAEAPGAYSFGPDVKVVSGAMAANSSANYRYTRRLGKGFAALFNRPDFTLPEATSLATILIPLAGNPFATTSAAEPST